MRASPTADRFWPKVNKTGPVPTFAPTLGPCWIWLAGSSKSNGGQYGAIRLSRTRRDMKAHRWAWEAENGPLPAGKQLDHLCRVTLCVNPSHLEPVTIKENVLRGNGMAARHARKTHCLNGHPFAGENTYTARNGQRMCRTCRRGWERERKVRLRHARSRAHSALAAE